MIGPLSWVLIYVADIPKMRQFYEEVLGLPIRRATDKVVVFRTGHCTLELMGNLANGPEQMDDAQGWARNKVLVSFHVEDIHAETARMEAAGYPCLTGIKATVSSIPGAPPRGFIAQFMDPEGNLIEFGQMPLEHD
ncbi:VOC family protein [Hydrogenophaga sp.]|uniref:VOC family protein n=1 Tax=Hydrogenophaga sp. TaxID=1904254 RepID=UPI002727A837|nr:VOC family protein [Hydrogenophaga sp.]MDO9435532.1 VOC family protein [Hydrogenophaga sp.]